MCSTAVGPSSSRPPLRALPVPLDMHVGAMSMSSNSEGMRVRALTALAHIGIPCSTCIRLVTLLMRARVCVFIMCALKAACHSL